MAARLIIILSLILSSISDSFAKYHYWINESLEKDLKSNNLKSYQHYLIFAIIYDDVEKTWLSLNEFEPKAISLIKEKNKYIFNVWEKKQIPDYYQAVPLEATFTIDTSKITLKSNGFEIIFSKSKEKYTRNSEIYIHYFINAMEGFYVNNSPRDTLQLKNLPEYYDPSDSSKIQDYKSNLISYIYKHNNANLISSDAFYIYIRIKETDYTLIGSNMKKVLLIESKDGKTLYRHPVCSKSGTKSN
jgi:hypothetical protein